MCTSKLRPPPAGSPPQIKEAWLIHPRCYGWVCCPGLACPPDPLHCLVAAHGQVSDTFIGKRIRLVSGATASTTSHSTYFKLTAPHPSGQLSSTGTPNYPPPISPSPCPFSPGVNSVYSLKACGLVDHAATVNHSAVSLTQLPTGDM